MRVRPFVILLVALLATGAAVYAGVESQRSSIALESCGGTVDCVKELALVKAQKGGISEGLAFLGDVYLSRPSFRGDCYGTALMFAEAVQKFGISVGESDMQREIAICNYGFLQQYPASRLIAGESIDSVAEFCSLVAANLRGDVPDASAECYRGMGRGLPFVQEALRHDPDAMSAYATQQCAAVTSDEGDYGACVSGVFNALGHAERRGLYGLTVESDAVALCSRQSDEFLRSRCLGNFKATVVGQLDLGDITAVAKYIHDTYGNASSDEMRPAFWTVGYQLGQYKFVQGATAEEVIRDCALLGETYEKDCIQGVSVGIAKNGTPWNQHLAVTDFCVAARREMSDLAPSDCPTEQAIGYLRGFYAPEMFEDALKHMRSHLDDVVLSPEGSYESLSRFR